MTNEEILTLGEQEFNSYIATEANKAVDKTLLNKKNELEAQKETLKQSIATLKEEANTAFDNYDTQTAATKGNEVDILESQIDIINETIQRLLDNHELLVVINHERIEELQSLVNSYYQPKFKVSKDEFETHAQTLVPLYETGEGLLKRHASLHTYLLRAKGQVHNATPDIFLNVGKRDALKTLLGG